MPSRQFLVISAAVCWMLTNAAFVQIQKYPHRQTFEYNKMNGNGKRKRSLFERSNLNFEHTQTSSVYIRDIQKNDLKRVSDILTASFFSTANILSWPTEWLKTFLSLEDSFSASSGDNFCMFVACDKSTDFVVGFCEIDSRLTSKPLNIPRPYMCNLAVDQDYRRRGIATALVQKCEEQAIKWEKEAIYLRVRRTNPSALEFYRGIQYEELLSALEGSDIHDDKNSDNNDIILLQKNIGNKCKTK